MAATITGTPGDDVILGTNGRDVIVAGAGDDIVKGRGGNDLICGGLGADRLFGGAGPDRHFGGVGDDLLVGRQGNDGLDGGPGTDTCYQDQGTGPIVSCELPATPVVVAPPVVTPPVTPPGPTPISLDGILAVAYTDLNGDHVYDTGDVMIAQLEDTNGDDFPTPGDTVTMGQYPTNLDPGPSDFGAWTATSHPAERVAKPLVDSVAVGTAGGDQLFSWSRQTATTSDEYAEFLVGTLNESIITDQPGSSTDSISTRPLSPSQPSDALALSAAGSGDDDFIDVELNYVVP